MPQDARHVVLRAMTPKVAIARFVFPEMSLPPISEFPPTSKYGYVCPLITHPLTVPEQLSRLTPYVPLSTMFKLDALIVDPMPPKSSPLPPQFRMVTLEIVSIPPPTIPLESAFSTMPAVIVQVPLAMMP